MVLNPDFAEAGGITLKGEPIDLGRIRIPAYFLSTREDIDTHLVLPASMKHETVVDQLTREYEWTVARLTEQGLVPVNS